MDLNFFPNDCNVCKKRTDLKRCSRCHMISYCSTEHQKKNWHIHKNICRIIAEITREKGLTHLYEDMRNCSPSIWTQARKAMIEQISSLMGRELKYFELEMLRYPRACYICYDTRQENLKNCPKCPLVSFCREHYESMTIHDEICADIKTCHTLERRKHVDEATKMMYSCTFDCSVYFKNLPSSTEEYLDKSLQTYKNLNLYLKLQASTIAYKPLTIFGILLKLNKTSSKNLTIFIHAEEGAFEMLNFCEILLHLLPNLKNLRVITDGVVQISNSGEKDVCKFCRAKGKSYQVTHICFLTKAIFDTVAVAIFLDLKPKKLLAMDDPTYFHVCYFSSEKVPVAFTTSSEIGMERLKKCYRKFCPEHTISYEGDNDFCSMLVDRSWENWTIKKNSEILLIATDSTIKKNDKQLPTKTNNPIDQKKVVERFYPGICQVCKSANAKEACTRCKMVFYCGQSHMKQNQSEHKDICKVILGLLNEKGTPHLFDKVAFGDEKSWFEAKLNFLKIARSKLNRELWNFEKEIFLFPKTCFVCHDSDLSVLKTCECCVSLCKIHRDDEEHKKLCKDFRFNLKWGRTKDELQKMTDITAFASKNDYKQQLSMEKFIDKFFHLKNSPGRSTEPNSRKIIISDFLSRPQTFIYAVEKLKIPITKSLQVHIIGALNEEIEHFAYWHSVTFWYKNLTDLCLCFVGPGTIDWNNVESKSRFNFLDNTPAKTKLCGTMLVDKRYDEFYNSNDFIKPDIIIGYNLDLNESNLGMTDCTWKETFSIISKINVPFLMTAKTEERGQKDHEMISSFLGKTINYDLFEKNPYASLMPERNYENEKLCYSNSYLIAYKQFPRDDARKDETCKKSENQSQKVENKSFALKANSVGEGNVQKSRNAEKVENNSSTVKTTNTIAAGNVENPSNSLGSEFKGISKLKQFAREQFSKVKVQKLLLEKMDEETKGEKEEKIIDDAIYNSVQSDEKLFQENLQLKDENKILNENLQLLEENNRLKEKITELNSN